MPKNSYNVAARGRGVTARRTQADRNRQPLQL